MASRLSLQIMLEGILGTRNVYYQPPESLKMQFPAIVYSRSNIQNKFANDGVYSQSNVYELTVIDDDPDSEIVTAISQIRGIRYNRHYYSNGYNHDVFILNF